MEHTLGPPERTAGLQAAPADVLIVGAGPCGLVLSLLLARSGHQVELVERWPAPYPLPRAVGMSRESMRVLNQIGIAERLEPLLTGTPSGGSNFLSGDGEVIAPIWQGDGLPDLVGFNQPDMEALLVEEVKANPRVRWRPNLVVTGLRETDEGVQVVAVPAGRDGEPRAGAEEISAAARFVVGCDGAQSTVRRLLDIPIDGDLEFSSDWLVVDLKPRVERNWRSGQILGPDRPVTLVPTAGPGRRRFEFMLMPGERKEDMGTEETAWRLLAELEVTPADATLIRHAVYTFRACWARQWRQGRVLLAGDAAHLTPPFMAQGMNSGIRDVATLSWRLDLVLRGLIPADTLDDYSRERVPQVSEMISATVALGRVICMLDPEECAQRDAMLRAAGPLPLSMQWRLGTDSLAADDPHAGTLGRQGIVRSGDREGYFDDVCGTGAYVLLSRRGDPLEWLSPAAREAWDLLGGIAVHVGKEAPVADVEGVYEAWFDEYGRDVILLRPDFYVFGTAATGDRADALVRELAASLRIDLPSQAPANA